MAGSATPPRNTSPGAGSGLGNGERPLRRRARERSKFRHVGRYSRHADSADQHRPFINRKAARIDRVRVTVQHIRFPGNNPGPSAAKPRGRGMNPAHLQFRRQCASAICIFNSV